MRTRGAEDRKAKGKTALLSVILGVSSNRWARRTIKEEQGFCIWKSVLCSLSGNDQNVTFKNEIRYTPQRYCNSDIFVERRSSGLIGRRTKRKEFMELAGCSDDSVLYLSDIKDIIIQQSHVRRA